ncbi:DUF4411 family protein [Methanobrevibacter sp.]
MNNEENVIDSSSLMHFEDRFPKDIVPSLWEEVYKLFENGDVFSVRAVYEELEDSQEFWQDYKKYFRELTVEESQAVTKILEDSRFEVFKNNGKKEGPWADPYLIACAMVDELVIVVTEENLNRNPQRKIAYVCKELGISCINFVEFLREVEVKI